MVENLPLLNMLITAGSGLIGVGIGIGVFHNSIKEIAVIKKRQAKLRGEENGGGTVFMPRTECNNERQKCSAASTKQVQELLDDLTSHTKSIRALDNFARWWMQEKGLHISEINNILGR